MINMDKEKLIEFGTKNGFQFPKLTEDDRISKPTLEMLREQDLDMYDIFGFNPSTGVEREDIEEFYNHLIRDI